MRTINELKKIRLNTNYTQRDVAEKLGVTQGAVSQWELNSCKPDYKYLPDLAKIYECTLEDIIKAINQQDTPPQSRHRAVGE